MKITPRRGGGAAAVIAGMALVGSAATVTTAPAQSAEPVDCAPTYADALTKGQAVTTKTVTEGTVPQEFDGKYVGTLADGIAPGIDMLLVDFASPEGQPSTEIDDKGIWAGMSGSPVYAEDGRLIGAVAYGLVNGDDPVAGVTPYTAMEEYMASPAAVTRKVTVSDKEAKAIAASTDVSASQASEGFRSLPMPLAYSGLDRGRLALVKKKGPDYFHARGVRAGGAASSATNAAPADLVPGGNLGAAVSYGTITLGGVGTVTNVCDGRLIGFGHPMTWGGKTSLGMMPAEAIRVMKDPFVSFKLANMGVPAGTIDQDRLTGISGPIGLDKVPDETDIRSTVSYGTRTRDGESHSLVQDYNADVTFTQLLSMHDVAIDSIQPGSETATYTITGTDADGESFDIAFGDRYTSEWDIAFEGIWDIADAMYALSGMRGVSVDDVSTTSDVTDSTAVWRVRGLEVRKNGHWAKVSRRTRLATRAGHTLRVRAVLGHADDTRTVPLRLRVPGKARRYGYLQVEGGASMWSNAVYRADTPAELESALENGVRNDQVRATLVIPRHGRNLRVSDVSAQQDLVVRGNRFVEVRIRR